MNRSLKKKIKTTALILISVLCFALIIFVIGFFGNIKKVKEGTIDLGNGIIITYTGLGYTEPADDELGERNRVEFTIFSERNLSAGKEIGFEKATIKAAEGSVNFLAKFKIGYKFYSDIEGKTEVDNVELQNFLTESDNFINSEWVESQNGDGFYYLAEGEELTELTSGGAAVSFFAEGAKCLIKETIVRVDAVLILEVAKAGADWSIFPDPIIEDFTTGNTLKDETGNVVTDVEDGQICQIVDVAGNGIKYKFDFADTENENFEANVVGFVGAPVNVQLPDQIIINNKTFIVTSVGAGALFCCESLESLSVSNKVKIIEASAIADCYNLTEIILGRGVAEIGDLAFCGCINLESITIPKGVVEMGQNPFAYCWELKNFVADGTFLAVGNGSILTKGEKLVAFAPASGTECKIPTGITEIMDLAFYFCKDLITVEIPDGVTAIGEGAFAACENLISVKVPDSLISIGASAFSNCISLISIKIPNGVSVIKESVFSYCCNLESIIISDSVKEIEECAFDGCEALKNLVIGSGVTNIKNQAFSGCGNLTEITVTAAVPPTIENNSMPSKLTTVYVPKGSVEAYKAADGWKNYSIYSSEG